MFSVIDLKNLEERHPNARFFVHDGYNGWSYGSPQTPMPVTLETACQLLNILCRKLPENELRDELEEEPTIIGSIEYAAEGSPLFHATLKNRFLAFYRNSAPTRIIPIDFPLPD
ncbi:MAG TPA: hypothetical protein VGI63_05270 [Verrucomicrobiae bacterium]|jgi:hypothetical protein